MPMEVHSEQPIPTIGGDYNAIWKRATQGKSKKPLSELITFDWTQDEASVNSFIDFITNLVTYNPSYTEESFTILVQSFEPYKMAIKQGATTIDYGKWEVIAMKTHLFFNKILQVSPLSSKILASVLSYNRFPHRVHPVDVHHFFFKNALFATRYCPSISLPIITSAIDSLILIDSSISLDEIPDEDEDLQFSIDEGNKSEGMQMAHKLDMLMTLMFQYLDACFGIATADNMFIFDGCQEQDVKTQDDMFHSLIKTFDNSVLPTYKSKYTQYLIFYACKVYQQKNIFQPLNTNSSLLNQQQNNVNTINAASNNNTTPTTSPFKLPTSPKLLAPNTLKTSHSPSKSPSRFKSFLTYDTPLIFNVNSRVQYTESYIRYLFSKLSNEKTPSLHRQSSAAYIGSYVSRAKYIPKHIVKLAYKELLSFALSYMDKHETKDSLPNPALHSIFYAVCQSIYYIFCFRNSIILDMSQLDQDKQRDYWQDLHEAMRRVSMSRLNPFKVCLKTVVKQFCSVCIRVGIFTKCTAILRANKKVVVTKSIFTSETALATNQFDSFFPFDPYLLKNSSKYINDIYLHWKDVANTNDDIDLEELSDDEEEDEDISDDDDVGTKKRVSSDEDSGYSDFEDEDDSNSDSDDDDDDDDDESESISDLTGSLMDLTPTPKGGFHDAASAHFKKRGFLN